jgi:PKD repeat protein
MTVAFSPKIRGLQVSFVNESAEVPEGSLYLWDFGDLNTITSTCATLEEPHYYSELGKYTVTLRIIKDGIELDYTQREVELITKTALSSKIKDQVITYIPDVLRPGFLTVKESYIEKWQLYIQPLVNHEVPVEHFNNEKYYEALENQLIMELAAYDYLVIELSKAVSNMAVATSKAMEIDETGNVTGSSDDSVKKISTGPSEVEFFDKYDSAAKIVKALGGNRASEPGLISMLKTNICMLANRLQIYLPFCGRPNDLVIPPIVVNRRRK